MHPQLDHLLSQRQPELDALFALLPIATAAEVAGDWHGTLMAVRGLEWLPRAAARGLYGLLSLPVNPWRGKRFAGAEGANRWLTGRDFGRFRVHAAVSDADGEPVLLLDYDVPENLRLLRPIRAEARGLGEGLLLARMRWRGTRVLYFALTRAE